VEVQREGDEVKEVLPIALAAPKSIRPALRPKNFAQVVDRAKQSTSATPTITSTVTSTVSPSIPSSASVSREATTRNAINLKKVNLIGVYGKPSNRRALVRLSNGRFRKVKVGDRIDGGRVSAIGDSELRYKKGSRNLVLKMPKS
jgi:type IV pilus biogenesis protein PilP